MQVKIVGKKYYDIERMTYDFPPPRNTPPRFIWEEYFSHYIRPQDRWAQENAESKMPMWMLNMLAVDGNLSCDSNNPP